MAEKNKDTKKKTTSKQTKSSAKHSAKNVNKKNASTSKKKSDAKKTNTKKKESPKNQSSNKDLTHKEKLQKIFKEKFSKNKTAPKTNKEKRMEKLQKLRAAKKRKKIALITGISVAGVYLLGCLIFTFVCFPRTIVADTDLSFQTKEFMKLSLIPNAGEYVFAADGLDFELEIDGKAIDYNFDVDQVVDRVIGLKNPLI